MSPRTAAHTGREIQENSRGTSCPALQALPQPCAELLREIPPGQVVSTQPGLFSPQLTFICPTCTLTIPTRVINQVWGFVLSPTAVPVPSLLLPIPACAIFPAVLFSQLFYFSSCSIFPAALSACARKGLWVSFPSITSSTPKISCPSNEHEKKHFLHQNPCRSPLTRTQDPKPVCDIFFLH